MRADVGAEEAEIFATHEVLLSDPLLLERLRGRLIRDRLFAEQAVEAKISDAAKRLVSLDDPFLRERSSDVRDVGRRLIARLSPRQNDAIAPLPPDSVRVAVELSPRTPSISIASTSRGSSRRSAEKPATSRSLHGRWAFRPSRPSTAPRVRFRRARRFWSTEMHEVHQHNLDGVGLFRTEFLFLDAREAPGLERQVGVYRQMIEALRGLPLTISTLDLGGDKIPLFLAPHTERNPSLGLRGLRFSLRERDLFETQLSAIARAGAVGPTRILFPMVLGDADLKEAVARLRGVRDRIGDDHRIEVGAMIETPAAVFLIDQILDEVDFVSLGTNDLTQFVLAADRDAIDLIRYSVLHPSVLRAIGRIVDAARERGRRVSVCGEAAGDPATAALLLGGGVRELSMSPRRSARVRHAISRIEQCDAEALASKVLGCRTSQNAAHQIAAFAKDVLGDVPTRAEHASQATP